jgi:ABC-2 type transport system permease protein
VTLDSLIVMRKELIELFGNKHSLRGAAIQAGVVILVMGVLVPVRHDAAWLTTATNAVSYIFFPAAIAAAVAADSFAGERERKTLETLLATPLSDESIFWGKTATAALFAVSIAFCSLLVGVVTVNVWTGPTELFFPGFGLFALVLAAALSAAFFSAALAVVISIYVPVARSAQQIASMLSMFVAAIAITALRTTDVSLNNEALLRVDILLLSLGAIALMAALRVFRRDKIFEQQ